MENQENIHKLKEHIRARVKENTPSESHEENIMGLIDSGTVWEYIQAQQNNMIEKVLQEINTLKNEAMALEDENINARYNMGKIAGFNQAIKLISELTK